MISTNSVVIQTQHCLCGMDFVSIFYWMVTINLEELDKWIKFLLLFGLIQGGEHVKLIDYTRGLIW